MEVGTRARSGSIVHILLLLATLHGIRATYYGKSLGRLSELHHGVSGEVFAIDARTLYLKDFTYDGQAPAAYFYAGNSRTPGNGGFQLKDEKGSTKVIRRYRKEGLVLTLPEGKTLGNVKWFSVWCEEFEVNFGDVKIPRNFDYPRPRKIDALKGVHGVSSDNIVIVDAQTLLVPNFSYDGEAPDAKFWVGRGSKPSPQGIRVHDENGKEIPLRRYDRKTIVLTLPGDLTVFDIGHFGVWCEAFTVDFGHIQIPSNLNVPPSLKMLGVSPQKRPRGFDLTEVSRQESQLVGGHLEATTYRPPQQFFSRQPQIAQRSISVENAPPPQSQEVQQPNYNQYYDHQQQLQQQQQQQQKLLQQLLLAQQLQQLNPHRRVELQHPFGFFPAFQQDQQRYQQQLLYNQLLQNHRFQEEQRLREHLNRQYNRVDDNSSKNYFFTG